MSTGLLVAQPEPDIRQFLGRHLTEDGFDVLEAEAAEEVLYLAERKQPGLVLVDTVLADGSGLDLCRRLREGEPGRLWDRNIALIFLGAAEADPVDRVRAFERGCDDYVGKPFLYDELVARIRAVLRRALPQPPDLIRADGIVVDPAARRVTVSGARVDLSGKEYQLLVKLAGEPTRVFTKDELLRDVWGFRTAGRTRTLDSHASRLRRKLGAAGSEEYVVNEWGVGYRLLSG